MSPWTAFFVAATELASIGAAVALWHALHEANITILGMSRELARRPLRAAPDPVPCRYEPGKPLVQRDLFATAEDPAMAQLRRERQERGE